jgi:oligopeptide/dipeptide ABC transporter ATP-binding protein
VDDTAILQVRNLTKTFRGARGLTRVFSRQGSATLVAVDNVSLTLRRHQILGLVGESGCGKTTLVRCLIRGVEPDAGEVLLDGRDVLAANRRQLRDIRRSIQLIYQDPYSALNPRFTIRRAIGEPALAHGLVKRRDEDEMVTELLERVGLSARDGSCRPRQLSGGQCQRGAIARALAVRPQVLLADEPVSALDVSIRAQILKLFHDLTTALGLSMLLISHDLAVIANLADRVAVMYLGQIVESGTPEQIFSKPRHPYTAALLRAHPRVESRPQERSPALHGELPSPFDIPSGCRFRARCPLVEKVCHEREPEPVEVSPGHFSRCHVLTRSSA